MPFSFGGQHDRIGFSCDGESCTVSIGGVSRTIPRQDLLQASPGGTGDSRQTGTRNGVPIGNASDTVALDGDSISQQTFGGWLDASAFAVSIGRIESGMLSGMQFGVGLSLGISPNTNPRASDGGATWRGAMVGLDTRSFGAVEGEVTGEGDITLDIDSVTNPDVDVDITNIQGHSDITWSDIPLRDGNFATGQGADSIEGQFYGDAHQEAGGVFERNGLLGAFGAKREQP